MWELAHLLLMGQTSRIVSQTMTSQHQRYQYNTKGTSDNRGGKINWTLLKVKKQEGSRGFHLLAIKRVPACLIFLIKTSNTMEQRKTCPHSHYVLSKFLIYVFHEHTNDDCFLPLSFDDFFFIVAGTDFDSYKQSTTVTNLKQEQQIHRTTDMVPFHPIPSLTVSQDFLVAQTVKNLPVVQETQVQSLGREDPLEQERATHSSILA